MTGIEGVENKLMSLEELERSIHSVLLVRTKRRVADDLDNLIDDSSDEQKRQNVLDEVDQNVIRPAVLKPQLILLMIKMAWP